MGAVCCAVSKGESDTMDPKTVSIGGATKVEYPNATDKKAKDDDKSEASDEDDDEDDEADLPPPPKNFKGRKSVSAEAYGKWNKKQQFKAPVHPKNAEQDRRIKNTLSRSFMFRALEDDDLKTCILAFVEVKKQPGDVVIKQGDEGDSLYLIESGEFEAWKKLKGDDGKEFEKMVKLMTPGDCFGELALLYNVPRAATVKAKSAGILWSLDRDSFNNIVKDAAQKKRQMYEDFLAEVELLKKMDPYERAKICDALKSEMFTDGQEVIKEGEMGNCFYMVEQGKLEALKNKKVVASYTRGQYFGELALLRDQPRAATIVARGLVKVASLDRGSFKRLLGPLEDILERNADKYKQAGAK